MPTTKKAPAKARAKKTTVKIDFHDTSKAIPALQMSVEENIPALLIGETGTGKTTLVRELAKSHGKELFRVSINGATSTEEIVGKWLLKEGKTYWVDGVLTTAMKQGHWIVFDEINAALPEVLFTLHSVLDDDRKIMIAEKDGEVIRPHNDFRFFATMNPCVSYAGTKDMNSALMSRFGVVLQIPHLPADMEQELLSNRHGIDRNTAGHYVQLGIQLRKMWKQEHIRYFCSTRDLLSAAQIFKKGKDYEQSLVVSILNKSETEEEREQILKVMGKSVADYLKGEQIDFGNAKKLWEENKQLRVKLAKMEANLEALQLHLKYTEELIESFITEIEILRSIVEELIQPMIDSLKQKAQEGKEAAEEVGDDEMAKKWKEVEEALNKKEKEIEGKMKKANVEPEKRDNLTSKNTKDKEELIKKLRVKVDKVEKEENASLQQSEERVETDPSITITA